LSRTSAGTPGLVAAVFRLLRRVGGVLAGTALAYGVVVLVVFVAELLRAILDEVDWEDGD
jgi:hypothetical protein